MTRPSAARSVVQSKDGLPGGAVTAYRHSVLYLRVLLLLSLCAFASVARLSAQATGSIRGTVLDPSGGAVPNVPVKATSATGQVFGVNTNATGAYDFTNLAPGPYKIEVTAPGFAPFSRDAVMVVAGRAQQIDISLQIQQEQQQVTVAEQALSVDTNPSNNASAVVLTEKELDALPDDPDELQEDLEALAGPSAGPNGGQMYVDGFTAGQLPPKSSIREIRINQNPFAPEFDKVGYGRIEIFTKPGTNQWHGQFSINANDSAFNTRNPFAGTSIAPYHSIQTDDNVGGPVGKKGSIFLNAQYRTIDDSSIVSPLDAPASLPPYSPAVLNPRTRVNVGPRFDYAVTKNNTFSVRYQFYLNDQKNNGIGAYDLPTQGYNTHSTESTLQATDTQLIGSKIVNETRFQYLGDTTTETPQSILPTIDIPGSVVAGGNNNGYSKDDQKHYEIQNYTSIAHGNHFIKFGVRFRDIADINTSYNGTTGGGFNGQFNFASPTSYGPPCPSCTYVVGGTSQQPNQFTIITGSPNAKVNMFDAGPYVQDDWRIKPNLTVSYGLRFEAQNDIHDHADLAPRFGLAWGLGGRGKTAPKTVLRAGWGLFYDRFAYTSILQAERLNGTTEQSYTITDPQTLFNLYNSTAYANYLNNPNGFFVPPNLQSTTSSIPTVYQIAPDLHAPRLMQSAVSVERQVTKFVNMSVSYLNSYGTHQLLTNNVNAPEPGTCDPVSTPACLQTAPRPNGIAENIDQFQSVGVFRQNQLVANTTVRAGAKLQLNAYYTLNYANSDTSGVGFFPSNPYDIMADYGRAGFDVRHRAFFGGTFAAPYGLRVSPFMTVSSGAPYNVTTNQDFIGSGITTNQRPAFCTNNSPGTTCISTPLGVFNPDPVGQSAANGSQIVPINYLTGPSQFSFNLRVSKTFNFGGKAEGPVGRQGGPGGGGGGGGRGLGGGGLAPRGQFPGGGGASNTGRYNVTLSVNARNFFNNVNLSTPNGVVTSTHFGQSNALAAGGGGPGGGAGAGGNGGAGVGGNSANRAIYLQAVFAF